MPRTFLFITLVPFPVHFLRQNEHVFLGVISEEETPGFTNLAEFLFHWPAAVEESGPEIDFENITAARTTVEEVVVFCNLRCTMPIKATPLEGLYTGMHLFHCTDVQSEPLTSFQKHCTAQILNCRAHLWDIEATSPPHTSLPSSAVRSGILWDVSSCWEGPVPRRGAYHCRKHIITMVNI